MKQINFIIILLLLVSCKKEKTIYIDKNRLKNRKITNIVQSCGTRCSITYNEKKITLINSLIEVSYKAVNYINEKKTDEFKGYFYISCSEKKAISVFFKDAKKENILNIHTNGMSYSFKPYADNLCECLSEK